MSCPMSRADRSEAGSNGRLSSRCLTRYGSRPKSPSALDYAHRQGVIHRDIKPDNVLFHDGRALVADFGIALTWSQGDDGNRLTRPGMGLGTPYYMSPEQAAGKLDLDPRTDIFALGVVLYEMLAGRLPFTGASIQEIFGQIMSDEAAPSINSRKTVPHHVVATVARALEKLPADRWQSAAQFADALAGRIPASGMGSRALPAALGRSAIPWTISAILLLALGWVGIPKGERAPVSRARCDSTPSSTPESNRPLHPSCDSAPTADSCS